MERYLRVYTALLGANAVFWIWFWWYFFTHGTTAEPQPIWEGASSWARAFGVGFGDGASMTATLNSPIIRVATLAFMPCFVVTWPIVQWAPVGFQLAGFDAQGLRLVLITVLSFAQWHLLARLLVCIASVFLGSRFQTPMHNHAKSNVSREVGRKGLP